MAGGEPALAEGPGLLAASRMVECRCGQSGAKGVSHALGTGLATAGLDGPTRSRADQELGLRGELRQGRFAGRWASPLQETFP